ncbi:MAG TPA: flagellar hook-basal body complex protein FliE [Conexibacter sp.]|jgi:flagellar hook-basal body complex protein FliE|nr:flagellar hook-basal body complex protein FliE [Conexibacter sp.]
MTLPPVAALGAEWQIPGIGAPTGPAAPDAIGAGVDGVAPSGGSSFGNVLTQQIGNLTDLQEGAASASQSLANGTAADVSSVVTAVEKAQLAMQLAGQIRTKGSEAINDIFHTQI